MALQPAKAPRSFRRSARALRKPAINSDLWRRLLDLCEKHDVKIEWVRGHAGHPENERCDFLAVQAAKSDDLQPDPGYTPSAAVRR